MAYDKVIDSTQLETALKATADSIREKTGTSDPITWLEELGFSEAIAGIKTGDNDLPPGVLYGIYVPAENTTTFSIPGYTGKSLSCFAINARTGFYGSVAQDTWALKAGVSTSLISGVTASVGLKSSSSQAVSSCITIADGVVTTTEFLRAGKEYMWMAWED